MSIVVVIACGIVTCMYMDQHWCITNGFTRNFEDLVKLLKSRKRYEHLRQLMHVSKII